MRDAELRSAAGADERLAAPASAIWPAGASRIVLFSASAPGVTEWVSDNIEQVTGFPPSRFIDDPQFWASRLHPEDRDHTIAALTLAVGQARCGPSYRWCVADGTYRWFADQFGVVPGDGGRARVIGVWLDLSDWMQIDRERRRLTAAVEAWVAAHAQDLELVWESRVSHLAQRRAYEAERNARRRTELLAAASAALGRHLELDLVVSTCARYLAAVTPCDGISVALFGADGRLTVRDFAPPECATPVRTATCAPSEAPPVAWVAENRRSVLVPDSLGDPYWSRPGLSPARCWLAVPLVSADTLLGVCTVTSDAPALLTTDHLVLAGTLAGQTAVAVANASLHEELKASHRQLRELSRDLVRVQEVERRALARDLHDEFGQQLTLLALTLEQAARQRRPAAARLGEASGIVTHLLDRVRALSMDLRPAMLDELGLLPALLWLVDRLSAQLGSEIRFVHSGADRRLGTEVETAAFRIAQEALSNVLRHAATARVSMWLRVDAEDLRLAVEDEGHGFDLETTRHSRGIGLVGMRERAAALGGDVLIDTRPGGGTCLLVTLPLNRRGAKRMNAT